ncbi:MAG: pyridoxamine kinase [Oscillospiraceae bacterium]|nr:pyridoxamine kinase [Oscillospiraceae bacterium]
MKQTLHPAKRIAAVHDLSGLGKCSLTVALPVISAAGVECSCLPTALLSTHTGEFKNFVIRDLSDDMLPIAEHWCSEGAKFDGIYSGYLASPRQGKLLEGVIAGLSDKDTLVIVDPVMADNGKYYHNFDHSMCLAFRRLCAVADVITPNVTEAAFLTGIDFKTPPHGKDYISALLDGLSRFGPKTIAVTGVRFSPGEVGIAAADLQSGKAYCVMRPVQPGVFYGTGDLFASSFAALSVRGAELRDALHISARLVSNAVERSMLRNTPRRFGVDFEGALPGYIRMVEKLFPSPEDEQIEL